MKKKPSMSKQVDRDGLKQLWLFDLKNLGSIAGHGNEVAKNPSPPGAGSDSSNFSHQDSQGKAAI